MEWVLPGTVLKANTEDAAFIEQQFRSIFMGGGIMLGQVATITGLETHDVQNWVKRGFLPPPEQKRYSMNQLCRIININMLRNVLPMEQICSLLSYINGDLDDASDDKIDDSELYFLFVRLAANYRDMGNAARRDVYISVLLENYKEKLSGDRNRVETVLRVMLTAWASAQLKTVAMQMLAELEEKP